MNMIVSGIPGAQHVEGRNVVVGNEERGRVFRKLTRKIKKAGARTIDRVHWLEFACLIV